MFSTVLLLTATVAAMIAVMPRFGSWRWHFRRRADLSALESTRRPFLPAIVNFSELSDLPAPVQRYFRAVLSDGQPMVTTVTVEHCGTFKVGATGNHWKPFTSTQRAVTRRPGFESSARIALMPGLHVMVRDAYVAGHGTLRAALFGLFSVAKRHDTAPSSQGDLLRFFAQAVWYPTVLLPSQGVRWTAVDDHSALATLTDDPTTVTLMVRFGANDLIESVRAEARGRLLRGKVVPTPWEVRWATYERRGGMYVPLEGEMAWLLADGPWTYWRGRVTDIDYEFTHNRAADALTHPRESDSAGTPVLAFAATRASVRN